MSRVKIASPRAELAVLRGMLHKDIEVSGPLISGVDESFFNSELAVEIYQYIRDCSHADGKVPKYRMVLEDPAISKAARTYLRDSEAQITSKQEARRAIRVLDKYRQHRELTRLAHVISEGLQKSKVDVDSLLDQTTSILANVRANKTSAEDFIHFGKNSSSAQMLERLLYGDRSEDIIPTGIKTFDDVNEGLIRSSLVTIGGNSGAGKSQLASSLAEKISSRGYNVVIVPLEMSHEEMASRIIAAIAKIDSLKILTGKLTDNEKELVKRRVRRWERKTAKRGGRYTIYKPTTDVSIEEVYSVVDAMSPDVCIIDYVTLLKEKPGVDQWKQLGQDARYSKINAEINKRVNILLCQIDDSGKIKYSRAINEHSTNSWVFLADEDTKEQGILKIQQTKSRNQHQFPFTLGINYSHSTVYDLEGYEDNRTVSDSDNRELPNLANQPDV